jgi:hypothetical protein
MFSLKNNLHMLRNASTFFECTLRMPGCRQAPAGGCLHVQPPEGRLEIRLGDFGSGGCRLVMNAVDPGILPDLHEMVFERCSNH